MKKGLSNTVLVLILILVVVISVIATLKIMDGLAVSKDNTREEIAEANVQLTILPQEDAEKTTQESNIGD